MPEIIRVDPVMKKYADLINGLTHNFKRTYFGDPIRIGVSELPALVIAKTKTIITNFDNQTDKHDMHIAFTVVTDVRDTINDDRDMVRGVNSLYNICEGRNDDYTLKADSLLYILRHYVEIDVAHNLRTDLMSATSLDFGMTIGKRKDGSWATEANGSIIATFYQVR